jgi:cytoskeleton protein RodZ
MNDTRNAPTAGAGPGKRLYEARIRAQLSAEQVAEMLHLSTHQITALEREEFDRLPGPTYVRGYLRNYAQLLGLPSDEIVQSYTRSNGAVRTARRNALAPEPEVTTRDATVRLATLLVGVTLILLAVVWWQGRSSKPTIPEPISQVQQEAPAGVEPDAVVSTEPIDEVDQGGENRTDVAPVVTAEETPAQPADVAPVQPQAEDIAETLPPDSAVAEPAPAEGDTAQLILHTRDTSWADIRDARGNKLVYRLVPAQQRIILTGIPPFEVFVGNPEAVTVEFNGEHVEAVKFKRGLVARFTLDLPVAAGN